MRFLFKLLGLALLLPVLAVAAFVGDLALNKRRVFYALLGRDALVAACRPPLQAKLRALGFEPTEIEFGETPDLFVSTSAGRTLNDTLTFADGASQTRVDGLVTCSVEDGVATVVVRTVTTPVRAS